MGEAHKKLAQSFQSGTPCAPGDLAGIGILSEAGMSDVLAEVPEAFRSRVEVVLTLADDAARNKAQTVKAQIAKTLADCSEQSVTEMEEEVLNAYLLAAHSRGIDDSSDLLGREHVDEPEETKKTVASRAGSGPVINATFTARTRGGEPEPRTGGSSRARREETAARKEVPDHFSRYLEAYQRSCRALVRASQMDGWAALRDQFLAGDSVIDWVKVRRTFDPAMDPSLAEGLEELYGLLLNGEHRHTAKYGPERVRAFRALVGLEP